MMASEGGEQESQRDAPITEAYAQQVRPFIDLIDNLRQYGLDQDVDLPAVAVIGDQSAGKSSALEAISGIQLPRGSGIVTRCPLVLRLKSTLSSENEWRGNISYKYKDGTNDRQCEDEIDDPAEVEEKVRFAQNRIAGENKGIMDELITLEVESPNVPDLTLIDLPGITRVAMDGQPHDIPEQIKKMIRNRIGRQETIILAVIPANVDIATTEALQMAQEFDPDGERTLGVVTKPDLIDKGTEDDLIAVVNNQRKPLRKGYTCVKCRGQQNIVDGQSLQEALQEEEAFFENTAHFSDVDQDLLGIKKLSVKLTHELVDAIMRCLPELKERVTFLIAETRAGLDELGQGTPEDPKGKMYFLMKLLMEFGERIAEVCSGDYSRVTSERHNLFTQARICYKDLLQRIAKNTPGCTSMFPSNSVAAPSVLSAATSSNPNVGFSFGKPVQSQSMFGATTAAPRAISSGVIPFTAREPGSHKEQFIVKIMKALEQHRGDELPRFMNYKVCRMLIREVIDLYTRHATRCLDSVEKQVETVHSEIANHIFAQFPKLCMEVKLKVNKIRQVAKETCKVRIQEIFEMEKMVFTQDRIFNHDLDVEQERKRQCNDYIVSSRVRNRSDDESAADMETRRLALGHQIATASMAELGEEEVRRQQAEEMYTMIKAYLEVSSRRMVDTIPMTIQLHLIRNIAEEIKISVLTMGTEPGNVEMVVEDQRIARKRNELQAKLERLEKADMELSKFV